VATSKKLLIDPFVAGAAIAGSQMSADGKAVVIYFLLTRGWLVTVKTIDALLRMSGHFVFMNH
jgi:hypothetical protein